MMKSTHDGQPGHYYVRDRWCIASNACPVLSPAALASLSGRILRLGRLGIRLASQTTACNGSVLHGMQREVPVMVAAYSSPSKA